MSTLNAALAEWGAIALEAGRVAEMLEPFHVATSRTGASTSGQVTCVAAEVARQTAVICRLGLTIERIAFAQESIAASLEEMLRSGLPTR